MPNDFSDTIHTAEREFKAWVNDTLEPALEAEWKVIKPDVMTLERTTLDIIWQAGFTYVTSGGNGFAAALAAVKAALPVEEKAAEHILATALAGAIANIQAKQAA